MLYISLICAALAAVNFVLIGTSGPGQKDNSAYWSIAFMFIAIISFIVHIS